MSYEQEEIESALIEFVRDNVVAKGVRVEPESVLREVGVDSYSVIEMVLFLERRFGIELPEEKLIPENLKSLRALAVCAAETSN